MKILLVGDRAREHMLAEQLARSCELYVAMQHRNPGIEKLCQKFFVCDYSNIEGIGSWAIQQDIDLAFVTSETALAKGLPDALTDIGLKVASPGSACSVIGENAVYALNLMKGAGIPTPGFTVCKNESEAKKALKETPRRVIKPAINVDWNGTRFTDTDLRKTSDALRYCKKMIRQHGAVVIEEVLDGEAFSLQGMTDGKNLYSMPPVHTAKRLLEGNLGDLTEGMGGYSTGMLLPFMRQEDFDDACGYLWKLICALKAKGAQYRGGIRGDFMVSRDGLKMLNVHATLGGVTTLNNMMNLKTQFSEVLTSVVEGTLKPMTFMEKATVVKFLVPKGYPAKPMKTSFNIDERALWNAGGKAYFECVEMQEKKLKTKKHRSVAVCASADTLEMAESKAEESAGVVSGILLHRSDIAKSEYVNRQKKQVALLRSQ